MAGLPFLPPTSLLAPSFVVARPTETDLDAMADCYFAAFETDPGNTFWWSPDRAAQTRWLRRRVLHKMPDPRTRPFKVVYVSSPASPSPPPSGGGGGGGGGGAGDGGGGGELVAWARWDVPRGSSAFGEKGEEGEESAGTATATAEAAALATATTAEGEVPEGGDPALLRCFFGGLQSMAKKWDADSALGT